MMGTDPGIPLKAKSEAMAIIAARPFCRKRDENKKYSEKKLKRNEIIFVHRELPYLELNLPVTIHLRRRSLFLDAQVVKVEVTRLTLGRLAPEVVAGVSNTLTLCNHNKGQDGAEPARFFLGKDTKSLGPVGLFREAREMQSEAQRILQNTRYRSENKEADNISLPRRISHLPLRWPRHRSMRA